MPVIERQLLHRHGRRAAARVVEEEIEPAKPLDDVIEERIYGSRVANIRFEWDHRIGQSRRHAGLLQPLEPAPRGDNRKIRADEPVRHSPADAAASAGDERYVSGCHRLLPPIERSQGSVITPRTHPPPAEARSGRLALQLLSAPVTQSPPIQIHPDPSPPIAVPGYALSIETRETGMTRVVVIQGAGMDVRGKTDVEIFGPETLDEINALIETHARDLGIEVEIHQSNDEQAVVDLLRGLDASTVDALIINPGGFTPTEGPLPETIASLPLPAYEVHASNPSARGVRSAILPACKGGVCGFGYAGYRLALEGIAVNR